MATTDNARSETFDLKPRSWSRQNGRFRFTVDQFYKLEELGFFGDRRTELIEGIIYEMTSKPAHSLALEFVHPALQAVFGIGWRIRGGSPLDLSRRTLIEPDFAVVAGDRHVAGLVHPTTAALIVEISDATLRKDRTLKVHIYALAGLPDYWIVNLVDRQLEVHRSPSPDPSRRGRFRYADVTIVPESGSMAPLAAPQSMIAVADLLPR
jgi:Uma2 family endonuclease